MKYSISISGRVLHFRRPAVTSRGIYTERMSWFVEVTDGVHTGVGECAPLPDLSCDAMPPEKYRKMLQEFCNVVAEEGDIDYDAMRDYPSMLFGLETALLSLAAHQKGSDCLFDTAFARGEQGIPINGLVWMGTYKEMAERMEEKLKQGFRCIKLKVGAIDFNQELELVKKIRNRFSHRDIELRLDANGMFSYDKRQHACERTPDMALYKLELLSQYAIHSIEQPIKAGQWANMALLCRDSPLPIALDEELIGINAPELKRQLLRIIKPAYIVLKPSLHGGMIGCREWVALAREEGIGSWITSALESNVGLNAIAQFCSDVYGDDVVFPQGLGTGLLFIDNIPMFLDIRGDRLWIAR